MQVSIRLSNRERKELITQMRDMAHPNVSFYALMILATLIASYGLLADSTAVVIGAMLVAPLMGPIFGMTLSLILGDRKLFFDSLFAEGTGVILAILIGVIIGSLPFCPEYGSEISARIQPTLYDAIIALASGLAGGYVLVNPKLNAGIAGVAIATALVPPLAVCGLELAAAAWVAAGSAFLLFVTNFFAIMLSSAVVFMLAGVERSHDPAQTRMMHLLKSFGPGIIALIGLTVFLTIRLVEVVGSQRLEDRITQRLAEQLAREVQGAELSETEIDFRAEPIRVKAVVLSSSVVDERHVKQLEDSVAAATGRRIDLMVRTYSTNDYKASGRYYWTDDEQNRAIALEKSQADHRVLDQLTTQLREYLQSVPEANLVSLQRDAARPDGRQAFTAEIETTNTITPKQVREMQELLSGNGAAGSAAEEDGIYLRVRQDTVRYADAEGYIFESRQEMSREGYYSMRELLRSRLEQLLVERQQGTVLEELHHLSGPDQRFWRSGNSGPPRRVRIIQATVLSPQLFTPDELAEMEQDLAGLINAPVWLQFDNRERAFIDSDGYNPGFNAAGGRPGAETILK